MATKTPTVQVRFQSAPRALTATPRILILGPIGTGGTASPSQVYRGQSEADVSALFGASDIVDAFRVALAAGLQRSYELYALGYDTTGWTANTWTVVATGTTTEAGERIFRFGDYTIPVSFASGDDGDAQATKIAAAFTASTAPLTAAVDGVTTNQVNVTSTYLGAHIQRVPLSVDLYRDRGELGVDGSTLAITNNEDATGTPTFTSTPLVEAYDIYTFPFRTTAYLDAVEAYLEAGWQDRNNFAHAFVAVSGSQSSVATFGDARNDKHISYGDISDAPIQEASAGVGIIDGVVREVQNQGTPNISGQRLALPRIPLPAITHDSETILDAGVSPIRVRSSTVTFVRTVVSYRETDGAEDLSQYDVGTVLALAEFGNRLTALAEQRILGKAIVAAGTPLQPRVARHAISADQVRTLVIDLLKELWSEAVLYAASEDQISDVITSIQTTEAGGITNGFEMILDAELVRHVTFFDALVVYL